MDNLTVEEKIKIMNEVRMFSGLRGNHEALNILVHLMRIKEFAAGETVIHEGKVEHEFFILLRGQVSVYKLTADATSYKVALLTADHNPAFGEGGLIEGDSRTATVMCDTKCEFLILSRDDFNRFCDQHPKWALPILRNIAKFLISRLHQSNKDLLLLHKALMHEIRG